MSYSMTVRTRNGVHEVIGATNVPDGEHRISGHDDQARVDLSIVRAGADGRFVASAQHSHTKEG